MTKKISKDNIDLASDQLWQKLKQGIDYLDKEDQKVVELAFTQMVLSHSEDRRKSGDYYITHPVEAALLLTKMKVRRDTLAACLLHDVPEDTTTTLKDLSKDFSSKIIFLIEGVAKFSILKYKGEKKYAESLRKMFVAMSKDIRVIFIKLADRIHNLQTLEYLPAKKRTRIALESLEIYAPIAERLGMNKFRGIIEDIAFKYVHPDEYKRLTNISKIDINRREKITKKVITETKVIIKKADIPFENIVGRAKKYYSIYKKLEKKDKTLEKIYDLVALRIVTYNVDYCYQALSLIHKHFEPIDGRIKDYILKPKPNGYRSIHTTVKDIKTGEVLEFQIRTKEMHNFAEYGVAAHWAYKEGKNSPDFKPGKFKWINELIDLGKKELKEEEYLKKVKLNLYTDRIFVMTPKGDVLDLEIGSTALDFAFKIHDEIGKTAMMAKINGEKAKLSDKLKNGDTIEIITKKHQYPTIDWLNKVVTSGAMKKIRKFINRKDS